MIEEIDQIAERFLAWLLTETEFGEWEPHIQREVRERLEAEIAAEWPQGRGLTE